MTLNADQLAELEEERRFLLHSLADLEREHAAGDVDAVDYRTLKDGYTARAADVLRAIDAGRPPRRVVRSKAEKRRTLLTIVTTLAVTAVVGFAVVRFVAPRKGGAGLTGDVPNSVAALLSSARQMQGTDAAGAIGVYQQVLKIDPDNAEARTYLGWMIANSYLRQDITEATATVVQKANMNAAETQLLDRAIVLKPNYADPKCFKAIVRFRFYADAAGATSSVEACLASNPPDVVAGLVSNLKTEIDAKLVAG